MKATEPCIPNFHIISRSACYKRDIFPLNKITHLIYSSLLEVGSYCITTYHPWIYLQVIHVATWHFHDIFVGAVHTEVLAVLPIVVIRTIALKASHQVDAGSSIEAGAVYALINIWERYTEASMYTYMYCPICIHVCANVLMDVRMYNVLMWSWIMQSLKFPGEYDYANCWCRMGRIVTVTGNLLVWPGRHWQLCFVTYWSDTCSLVWHWQLTCNILVWHI